MKNLLAVIPLAVAIGILVMAFGAKADSEHPIFGNDIDAILVADSAATEPRPESPGNDREASDIVYLPDIIVRPDPVEQEVVIDPKVKGD